MVMSRAGARRVRGCASFFLWPWKLCGPGSRYCPDCRRQELERRHKWCRQHEWIGLVGLTHALGAIPAEMR